MMNLMKNKIFSVLVGLLAVFLPVGGINLVHT